MMRNALARALIGALLLVGASVSNAGVIETVNAVRASGCAQRVPESRALTAELALDEAAKHLADGTELGEATAAAGYDAERSASIYLRSPRGNDLRQLLAQRFCDTVSDPGLSEAGVFQQGDRTWIVLARPRRADVVDADDAVDRVVALINEARTQARLCGRTELAAAAPLRQSSLLESAAQIHARDLGATRRLGHDGSDGSRPSDRVSRVGYRWSAVAENVAAGPVTAEAAVEIWLASPGHCANLMSDHYSETGVAYAVDPSRGGRVYWVQVFASPMHGAHRSGTKPDSGVSS